MITAETARETEPNLGSIERAVCRAIDEGRSSIYMSVSFGGMHLDAPLMQLVMRHRDKLTELGYIIEVKKSWWYTDVKLSWDKR